MSATVVRTAVLENAKRPGETLRVTLYEGSASHGYRTNYAHVAQRWVVITRSWQDNTWTGRRDVYRYSGKRYDQATSDYASLAGSLPAVAA